MAYDFQVVVDSADPHALADWWAHLLGWNVEPSDETFIRQMVAEGHATEADTKWHHGVLVWAAGAAIRHPDGPQTGPGGRRVLFQAVPEPKTVKNRVHLDIRVGAERQEELLEHLTAHGATFLHRGTQGPHGWITIQDPEGNELCLT